MVYMTMLLVTPDVQEPKEQYTTFRFKLILKNLSSSGYIRFKDGNQEFVARKPKDVGQGGFLQKKSSISPFDQKGTMILSGKASLELVRLRTPSDQSQC